MPARFINVALLALILAAPSQADEPAPEFFENQVRPLLVKVCQECHGPTKQRSALRVDSRAALLRGGDGGPAVVPGEPAKSLLIEVIGHKTDLRMPPKAKLSADQISVLTRWVEMGAPWPGEAQSAPLRSGALSDKDRQFWSFQPVRKPAIPAVQDGSWPKTEVDRFILARLEAKGVKPAPPADKRNLLRRATFDLIGLPPTPGEVDAFLADTSPDAFAKVVERLLASPHYGERWGRHWLDVVRYADTAGETANARDVALTGYTGGPPHFTGPEGNTLRFTTSGDHAPHRAACQLTPDPKLKCVGAGDKPEPTIGDAYDYVWGLSGWAAWCDKVSHKEGCRIRVAGLKDAEIAAQKIDGSKVELSLHRGRTGWNGPLEEWYWLIGNPRRIAPGFWYGADPFMGAALRANSQTKGSLYDTSPPRLKFEKRTRPLLEEVVREVTKTCTTDRERAEALLKWVYQMRSDPSGKTGRFVPRLPAELPADPDAAEHVIKEGGGSCEWVGRLFVSLAQVAELPTRLVIRMVHTQAEVYLDGKWELFDPLMGDHGEKFLNQPGGMFAGKSALEIYPSAAAKEEFAVARYFLGEERHRQWLELKPVPGKSKRPFEAPTAKPVLSETFNGDSLPLKPVPPPPPPTNLSMTHGKWTVKEGRARIEFAQGYFYHMCQAVAGEEGWKDVGIDAVVWREPKPLQSHRPAGVAGVVFRARGQDYNAVLLVDEDAVLVVRVEDGWKIRVLGRFPFPVTREGPAKLYVDCRGESAAVWLDGRYLGRVQQGLWPAGRVGLAAVQNASFDDLKVWLAPPLAPPPEPLRPAASTNVATTEDFQVANLLEWDRLLLDVPVPAPQCQPEYSTDGGKTWQPVPADHRLNEVDPGPGRIRFRLRLPNDAGEVRLGVDYRVSKNMKLAPR